MSLRAGAIGVLAATLLTTAILSLSLVAGVAVLALVALAGVLWLARRTIAPGDVAFVAAMAFAPLNAVRATPSVTIADLWLVAALILLIGRLSAWRPSRATSWVLVGLVTILVGGAVSCLVNADDAGLSLLLRTAPAAAVTVGVCVLAITDRSHAIAAALSYGAGAAVSVALGQFLDRSNPVVGRSYGLAVDSNHFAFTCVLGAAAAGYAALATRSRYLRAVAVVALIASFTGVMLSGSRAGAIGAVVIAASIVIARWQTGAGVSTLVVGAGAVVVVVVGGAAGSNNALARLLGLTSEGSLSAQLSDDSRSVLLANLLNGIQSHPIFGLGWSYVREAHIQILQVVVGAGVIGLAGYVLVVIGLVDVCQRLWGSRQAETLPLIGAAVAFLVMGLGQNIMWDRYVWLVLGVALAVGSMTRTAHQQTTAVDGR